MSAERLMLRRALGNLLSNAIRHATPNSLLQVIIAADQAMISINIDNAGEPIAPDYLERIFDRFFRLDAARFAHEGTGLGLAIARSIIMAHGGVVSASSSGGVTRFTVKLPACRVLSAP